MKQESISERITRLYDFWCDIIGEDTVPPRSTFARWCGAFDSDLIEAVIVQTQRKREKEEKSKQFMDADALARYCSGTLRHMREQSEAESAYV